MEEIKDFIKDGKLDIIVRPNSPKSQIRSWDDSRQALRIDIKAKPEDNKANIELIKFLTRKTGKKVSFVSGQTSKRKTLIFK